MTLRKIITATTLVGTIVVLPLLFVIVVLPRHDHQTVTQQAPDQANAQEAMVLIIQADMARDQRRYHDAHGLYSKVLQSHPLQQNALMGRAITSYQMRNWEAALEDLEILGKLPGSRSVEFHYLRGVCRSFVGRIRDAVGDLSTVIDKDPSWIDAYIGRGRAQVNLGNCDAALSDFNYYLSKRPEAIEIHADRAAAHICLGMLAEARHDLDIYFKHFGCDDTYAMLEDVLQAAESDKNNIGTEK